MSTIEQPANPASTGGTIVVTGDSSRLSIREANKTLETWSTLRRTKLGWPTAKSISKLAVVSNIWSRIVREVIVEDPETSPDAFIQILVEISENSPLFIPERLIVRGMEFDRVSCLALRTALEKNRTISDVRLPGCRLVDDDVTYDSLILGNKKFIRTIDLSRTGLTDVFLAILLDRTAVFDGLLGLDLSFNDFSDGTIERFLDALLTRKRASGLVDEYPLESLNVLPVRLSRAI